MNRRTIRSVSVFGGLLVVAGITSVLFQNCSQAKFDDMGSAEFSSQIPSNDMVDLDSPYQSGVAEASTHSAAPAAEEDIITPRLVFSSTPNGTPQKVFIPGQTVYARAYGLSGNKGNLKLYITQLETSLCLRGHGDCSPYLTNSYAKTIAKGLSYNAANKTWNFQLKFAFDVARKVILVDETRDPLTMDGHCHSGTPPLTSWCTNVGQVENTVVVRSPQPRILATVEEQLDPNSDTFGAVLDILDHKVWTIYAPPGARRFIFTGVPAGAQVRYCSEFAGSGTCANKGNWVMGKTPAPYVGLAQTFKIDRTIGETTYYCKARQLTEPFNKTLNFYAEDINSGVRAQATFAYGSPVEGCQPSSTWR